MADVPQNMAAVVECDIELEVSAINSAPPGTADEFFVQALSGIMKERNVQAAEFDTASGDVVRPDVWLCRDLIFFFSYPRLSMKLIGLFDLLTPEARFKSDKDRQDIQQQKMSNVGLEFNLAMENAELAVNKSWPLAELPIFDQSTRKSEMLDYESIDVARAAFNSLRLKSRFDSGVLSDWYNCHLASDHQIRINRLRGSEAILAGHDPTSSWRWGDSELPLISEPPLEFTSMNVQEAIEAIQSWMDINFQHENNNPALHKFIEERGFPWGEPHSARTITQEIFEHHLPADVLAAAITAISVDGETWFPHEGRLPPDIAMPSPDAATTHAQMQQCIAKKLTRGYRRYRIIAPE